MDDYIARLMDSLQAGEDSQVYNYTQREMAKSALKKFLSCDTIDLMYNTGYYHDCDEYISRDIAGMKSANGIRRIIGHFRALEYAMEHINEAITYEHIKNIHNLIYDGTPVYMTRAVTASLKNEDNTGALREVTTLHSAIILSGGAILTAGIVSYWHCLDNHITPFYIHADNRDTYKRCLKDIINADDDLREIHQNKLAELFEIEQERYRRETEAML